MRRYALLFAMLLVFSAQSALADCYSYMLVEYQTTVWWDGTITYQILNIYDLTFCNVYWSPPPPDCCGGGGPSTTPPSVNLAFVDTTDIYNPIVAVDVASNDSYDQVAWVILEVNGSTQDYAGFLGNARYQLHLPMIPNYGEGSVGLNGKACTGTGVCGESPATMTRYTPSPATAGEEISASWQEEDPDGPVTRYGAYGHGIRQMYTTTTFTCSEVGGNSHVQVKESLVTISSVYPMPMWSGSVQTNGTINGASYGLSDTWENPANCTYPTQCSSKTGSAAGAFGYAPLVDDSVGSFVIEGHPALITGGSLHVTF